MAVEVMPKALEAGWSRIDWEKTQSKVTKLQTKIYQAAKSGDKTQVVRLQKLLIHSFSAKLFAVQAVSKGCQGKKQKTGVNNPEAMLNLASALELDGKASPLTGLFEPPEDPEMLFRFIEEQAKQTLAKMALEPEWEAVFEPNSYGFRPGRNEQDAIAFLAKALKKPDQYFLEVNLEGCFNNISYNGLLQKLKTFPQMEKQIRVWLKAGIFQGNGFKKRDFEGIKKRITTLNAHSDGILPLLGNIALHGLEKHLIQYISFNSQKEIAVSALNFVRYADNWVILHNNLNIIKQCQIESQNWLNTRGIQFPQENTRIAHTLHCLTEDKSETPGFDFLGFNFRAFVVGKYQEKTSSNHENEGIILKIKPSKTSERDFLDRVKNILETSHNQPPSVMVARLNYWIQTWANYFKIGSHSVESFRKLQNLMYSIYLNWGKKRFSQKGKGYIHQKIFHPGVSSRWKFGWKTGKTKDLTQTLYEFPYTPYISVNADKSPYDGDLKYWQNRDKYHQKLWRVHPH